MTRETRERIKAYKKLLPDMRERVFGVAVLLLTSVAMMVTASFAWITLSRAPEVTGMQTTVAANGNLEIALANGSVSDPTAPSESKVGDSSATERKTIVEANNTWGNLINVSDPSYGVSEIALRPALFNENNKTTPLLGAAYGADGRVHSTQEKYEFASYSKNAAGEDYFAAGENALGQSLVHLGVRAITSITYASQNTEANINMQKYWETTTYFYQSAQSYYGKLVSENKLPENTLYDAENVTCISALQGLVTVFAQDEINSRGFGNGEETKTPCNEYIWYVYQMMLRLDTVLKDEENALLELANWEAYAYSGEATNKREFSSFDVLSKQYETWTIEDKDGKAHSLSQETKDTIKAHITDRAKLQNCIDGLKSDAEKWCEPWNGKIMDNIDTDELIYWDDIADYVTPMVDISTATLKGYVISEMGKSAILDIGLDAVSKKEQEVLVFGGLLYDMEARLINQTNRVAAKVSVTVDTNVMGEMTIIGRVKTSVGKKGTTPTYLTAVNKASQMQSTARGEATAKETYGMALDIWVRTNHPNAILTLEGSAVYEDQQVKGIDANGNTVDIYVAFIENESTDVYKIDDTWYTTAHDAVSAEELGGETPTPKMEPVIVGYRGENRVWEDWEQMLENGLIMQDATTQGAGSCFVFYANTPAEQEKILELLAHFQVKFIDQEGMLLGTAKLNVKSAYINQGKVTVPLEMSEKGVLYNNEKGEEQRGILQMKQNTPTMITAIIYVDGQEITNENVLSKGELKGQLNIQFGTDKLLVAPDNEKLQSEYRTITAEVTVGDQTTTNSIIGEPDGLEYEENGYTTTVKLTVEGEQPKRISGFFVRVINSTQGTRGEEKTFTPQGDGTWVATFNLKTPGKHEFNTVVVDGIQYTLRTTGEQTGTYPGLLIKGLRAKVEFTEERGPGTYMAAEASFDIPVKVTVEAEKEPKTVMAQFVNVENNKVYDAILTSQNGTLWTGTATIGSSGNYIVKYIYVDGEAIEAPTTGMFMIRLGLKLSVGTDIPQDQRTYDFKGKSYINMTAVIFDDKGQPIKQLEEVVLYYNNVISPAPMTWNPQKECYEGMFEILKPGRLTFQKLSLGERIGTITVASVAPEFLVRSTEIPAYKQSVITKETEYILGSDDKAVVRVDLTGAETAQNVWAEFQRQSAGEQAQNQRNSELVYIQAAEDETNTLNFFLTENGIYTLKRVFLQEVPGKETGVWYANTNEAPTANTVDAFMVLEVTNNPTVEVIASYNVQVTYGGSPQLNPFTVAFGDKNAQFMTKYTSDELSVKITDYAGRTIDILESVTWQIKHDQKTMESYGGYSGAAAMYELVMLSQAQDDQTKYVASPQTFSVAGQYTSVIKANMKDGRTMDVTIVPTFEVRSKKPSVTVSKVSPDGDVDTKLQYSGSDSLSYTISETKQNKVDTTDNTKVIVYAYAKASTSEGESVSTSDAGFVFPVVTFMVSGVADQSVVKFTIPKGDTAAKEVSITGNKEAEYKLGSNEKAKEVSGCLTTSTCWSYLGHGKEVKIETVSLTHGGITYTVKLDKTIVIVNPTSKATEK